MNGNDLDKGTKIIPLLWTNIPMSFLLYSITDISWVVYHTQGCVPWTTEGEMVVLYNKGLFNNPHNLYVSIYFFSFCNLFFKLLRTIFIYLLEEMVYKRDSETKFESYTKMFTFFLLHR